MLSNLHLFMYMQYMQNAQEKSNTTPKQLL